MQIFSQIYRLLKNHYRTHLTFWCQKCPLGETIIFWYTPLVSNHSEKLSLTSVKNSSKSDDYNFEIQVNFFSQFSSIKVNLRYETPRGANKIFIINPLETFFLVFYKFPLEHFSSFIIVKLCAKNHKILILENQICHHSCTDAKMSVIP